MNSSAIKSKSSLTLRNLYPGGKHPKMRGTEWQEKPHKMVFESGPNKGKSKGAQQILLERGYMLNQIKEMKLEECITNYTSLFTRPRKNEVKLSEKKLKAELIRDISSVVDQEVTPCEKYCGICIHAEHKFEYGQQKGGGDNQVKRAIEIVKIKYPSEENIVNWLFDQSSGHCAYADDA